MDWDQITLFDISMEKYKITKPIRLIELFAGVDYNKASKDNSRMNLYKQAGNSIVKNVLVAILGEMIPGKENAYKEAGGDGD